MPVTLLYDSNIQLDSARLFGDSTDFLLDAPSATPLYFFGPRTMFTFLKDAEYTVAFDVTCKKNADFDALLEIYFVGTAFPESNPLGVKVGEVWCSGTNRYQVFDRQTFNTIAQVAGSGHLRFVVYGGQWHVGNVKLTSATERGFNGDIAEVLVPIEGRRFENLQFKAELLDINGNTVPFAVSSSYSFFNGGNYVFRGVDHRVDGIITVGGSGNGPTIGTDATGSYIGIKDGGLATPVSLAALPTYNGGAQISMYSSSAGIGFQIVGGIPGGSYLDFSTDTGTLTIRGDITLIPGSALSQSITNITTGSSGLSLLQIQQLVSGTFFGGTFISGNQIFSPVIAGNTGFFSKQFGVGDISGGRGIILSAIGYTGSDGVPVPNAPAIYIGRGKFRDDQTPFLVASSSVGPVFSLGNLFVFESLGGGSWILNGSGSFAFPSGSGYYGYKDYTDLRATAISASITQQQLQFSQSLAAQNIAISQSVISLSASLAQLSASILDSPSSSLLFSASQAIINAQFSASIVSISASVAQTSASLISEIQARIAAESAYSASAAISFYNLQAQISAFTGSASQSQATGGVVDSVNRITLPTSFKTVPGLYLESASMGFWQPHVSGTGNSAANFPLVFNADGQFRVANSASWAGTQALGSFQEQIGFANGAFLVKTKTLLLDTPGMQLSGQYTASAIANFIKLGANAANISLTNGAGFYADGAGNFRIGSDITGSDYIRMSAGNSLFISSSFFSLNSSVGATALAINPFTIALGNPIPTSFSPLGAVGFYANRDGQVFFGSGSVGASAGAGTGSWISFGGTDLNVRTQKLFLSSNGLFIQGTDSSASLANVIKLGVNAQNITLNNRDGFYVDGAGNLRVGNDVSGSNYIQFVPGSTLTIKSNVFSFVGGSTFQMDTAGIGIGSPRPTVYNPTNAIGFYANVAGQMFIGSGSVNTTAGSGFGSWISFSGTELNIKTNKIFLNGAGLQIQGASDLSATANVIKLGTNAGSISLTAGDGFYADGAGNFRIGRATSTPEYLSWFGGALVVKASNFQFLANDGTNTLALTPYSMSMGTNGAVPVVYNPSSAKGALINAAGQFFFGSGSVTNGVGNWMNFDGTTLKVNGILSMTGGSTLLGVDVANYLGKLNGQQIVKDPQFEMGLSYVTVYNNNGGSAVLHSVIPASTAPGGYSPNSSGQVLKIDVDTTRGTTTPGFGGFTFLITNNTSAYPRVGTYRVGNVIVWRITAYIPVGQTINFGSNSYGNEGTYTWLTSQAGTGNWFTYIARQVIGTTGTFSSTGYWYILGGASPFVWYVASAEGVVLDSPDLSTSAIRGENLPIMTNFPTVAGLYMSQNLMGFHNGNGLVTGWTAYIANDGKFLFQGNASNFIKWDGVNFTVAGTINVIAGNAAKTDFTNVTANYAAANAPNGIATNTSNVVGTPGATVVAGATLANTNLNANGIATAIRSTNLPVVNPAVAGLYITNFGLGYHNGNSAQSGWTSYIAATGQFFFTGNGANSISWNGSTLDVRATTFILSTTKFKIDSTFAGNVGAMLLGNATNFTTGIGAYIDGNGSFRFGDPAGNRLEWNSANNNIIVQAGTLKLSISSMKIDSTNNGGYIALGAATAYGSGIGFYADGNGLFRVGNPGGNQLTWDGSSLVVNGTIASTTFTSTNPQFAGNLTLGSAPGFGPSLITISAYSSFSSAILGFADPFNFSINVPGRTIQLLQNTYIISDLVVHRGNATGVVYLGNQANGSAYLYFDGSQYIFPNFSVNAPSFFTNSSRTLKENIKPYIDSALDAVNKINIVNYHLIADKNKWQRVGFIAEDTDALLSTPNKDSMDMANTLGLALKALQELDEKYKAVLDELKNLRKK